MGSATSAHPLPLEDGLVSHPTPVRKQAAAPSTPGRDAVAATRASRPVAPRAAISSSDPVQPQLDSLASPDSRQSLFPPSCRLPPCPEPRCFLPRVCRGTSFLLRSLLSSSRRLLAISAGERGVSLKAEVRGAEKKKTSWERGSSAAASASPRTCPGCGDERW